LRLGLTGELWMLNRLLSSMGPEAVDAWTGPQREPHDFRVRDVEFEVKSTRSVERVHLINGLTQLVPSLDRSLWLVSLQFEPAGLHAGQSLPEMLTEIRAALTVNARALQKFNDLLSRAYGQINLHADYYAERLQLRTPAQLVPIDSRCPVIT